MLYHCRIAHVAGTSRFIRSGADFCDRKGVPPAGLTRRRATTSGQGVKDENLFGKKKCGKKTKSPMSVLIVKWRGPAPRGGFASRLT
jgi:hypothetical protein